MQRELTVTRAHPFLDKPKRGDLPNTFGSVTARGFGRVPLVVSPSPRLHAWCSAIGSALGPVTIDRSFVVPAVPRNEQ